MNVSRSGLPPRSSPQVFATLENPRKLYYQDFYSLRDAHLKRGTLFVDEAFPAKLDSIGSGKELDINIRRIEWRRPTEIVKNPELIVNGTSLYDILQSKRLGDCWFLCAMGALTLKPNLLRNIMPTDQKYSANYAGIFHFRLWHHGEWVDIVIDDLLPFLGGELLYVRPSSANEFWPCLLEKAYAKLLGSYQNLHWGFPEEAFVNLTGGVTMTLDLKSDQRNYLWHTVSNASPDTVMACVHAKKEGTPRDRRMSLPVVKEALDFRRGSEPYSNIEDNPVLINGLVQSHAYCITGAAQVKVRNGSVHLIRLWNPWGQGEWKGPWNDRSSAWMELREEDRQRLHRVRNDGEFWMSWEDFCLEFSIIILCNHIPDFLDWGTQNKKWYKKVFRKRWSNNGNERESFSRNPQYVITVNSSDEVINGYNVVISLMQSSKNRQKFGGQWLPIGFIVIKLDSQFQGALGPLPASFFHQERLTKLEACRQRDSTKGYKLAAGKYIVVPYTTGGEKEPSFLLQIFLKSENCAIELSSVENLKEHQPLACENVSRLSANKEHETLLYESVFRRYATKGFATTAWDLQKCLNDVFLKESPYHNGVKFTIDGSRALLASMDHGGRGKLELENFCNLWRNLLQFKDLFADIDSNRCGFLNSEELHRALKGAELNISKDLLNRLVVRFGDSEDKLNFVDYLLCMVRLKMVAKTFKRLTDDGRGVYLNQEKWYALMV